MYESSGSQLVRSTNGIQSGPEAFDESRFFMTFLIISGFKRNIMQFQISPRREIR